MSSMLLLASGANAQEAKPAPGFALDRYNPAERGSAWFVVDSLDLRGHTRPAVGLTMDYAHQPLAIYASADDADPRVAVVSGQLYAHLGSSIVLFDTVRLGLNVPLALLNSGNDGVAEGYSVKAPTGVAIGDVRLGADVRLIGVYGSPFAVTLGVQVFVPSGKPAGFTGDGKIRLLPRVLAAGTVGMFTYGASLGVLYRANDTGFAGKETGTEFSFGASAGLRALNGNLVIGPEFFGSTVVSSAVVTPTPSDSPLELLLGAHYTAGPIRFGAGAGPGLTRGLGTPTARVLASIDWAPPADADGDGIADKDDACVTVPGITHSNPKKHGCPSDKDDDGIIDVVDACVTVPGISHSEPKKHGCPSDRDDDKILDVDDACPDVRGAPSKDSKLNGCPVDQDSGVELVLDRDGDKVHDDIDVCIDEPGLKDPPSTVPAERIAEWTRKYLGCPEDPDKDKILNLDDMCWREPGVKDLKDPRVNGCPAKPSVVVFIDSCEIKLIKRVNFKTGSANLETSPFSAQGKETTAVLTAVRDVMRDNPQLKKIEVQGHASRDGFPGNQKLSDDRAMEVVKWLVDKGIDSLRLTPQGLGETVPLPWGPVIGPKSPKKDKELHQRVEFHIRNCQAGRIQSTSESSSTSSTAKRDESK